MQLAGEIGCNFQAADDLASVCFSKHKTHSPEPTAFQSPLMSAGGAADGSSKAVLGGTPWQAGGFTARWVLHQFPDVPSVWLLHQAMQQA
jgi:hypothetical protein